MEKFEYVKWYWKQTDEKTPVILFYEVDLENKRYAARMAEVYPDRSVVPVIEEGFEYITEAPIPVIEEINTEPEFFAEIISKEEFESIYNQKYYSQDIGFPKTDNA